MKKKLTLTAFVMAASLSLPVSAQFAKPEDAIKYRQSSMFLMGQNMGRLGAMAQGRIPFDPKAAAEAAANVEFLARLPWGSFGEGTDQPTKNRARPEIWKERAKFNELSDKLQTEAGKLNVAAKTGSLDAIKAAMGGVGGTCKSCHDSFQSSP